MWMLYLKLSGIASCCISVPDSLFVSFLSLCQQDRANHLWFQHSGLKSKQTLVRTFPFYTTIRKKKKIVYSSLHAHYPAIIGVAITSYFAAARVLFCATLGASLRPNSYSLIIAFSSNLRLRLRLRLHFVTSTTSAITSSTACITTHYYCDLWRRN